MKRSVLLVSLAEDDAWVSAIEEGLKEYGLHLVVIHDEVNLSVDDNSVFLASHVSKFKDCDFEERAVVIGASCPSVTGDQPVDVATLRTLSGLYADAAMWARGEFFRPARMQEAVASRPDIELFPGVWIRPPSDCGGSELKPDASANAMLSLHGHGMPKCGQITSWDPRYLNAVSLRGDPLDAAAALDMAGPPRPLVKGPYFTLTPGVWQVVCEFTLDDMATRNDLRIEWGPPERFVSVRARPKSAGRYRVSLTQEWKETSYAELIVELMNGCIGGKIQITDVKVEYVRAAREELSEQ